MTVAQNAKIMYVSSISPLAKTKPKFPFWHIVFTKLPLLGFFIKVTQTNQNLETLFFKNKTNNKVSGKLSQLWQVRDA